MGTALFYQGDQKLTTTDDGITVDKGVTIDGIEGGDGKYVLRADGDDNNDTFRFVVSDGGTGLKIQGYDGSFQTRFTVATDGTTTVAQNLAVGLGVTISPDGDIHATGITTFAKQIVGISTNNLVPFLFNNYSDLPSASDYHGQFYHVHVVVRHSTHTRCMV